MRRLWLGLGCILLAGCADFFKPSDDREPLPALNSLDSAAIAKMKISIGVWNGNVRDWIGTYFQTGRVRSLNVVLNRGAKVDFPDTGLEYVEDVNFRVASDTLIVGGFSRFSSVTSLAFFGIDGHKMNAWPRGVYLSGNVKDFSIGEGGVTAIEDSLKYLKNMNFLGVVGNEIASLPAWIYEKEGFSIWVSKNRLCSVDSVQANWLNAHAQSWKYQRCP